MPTEGFAPAKINLSLHVTGQRPDGYHLLDSLVVFADVGDRVGLSDTAGLQVTGPYGGAVPAGGDNLVMRAARLMTADAGLSLEKNLPPASGIGGGSSDAAAALRVLAKALGKPLPPRADALRLGADVPVCLQAASVRMQGVGDTLDPVTLPPVWAVLVNPGLEVPTPHVFRALACKNNAAMPDIPALADAVALAAWLGGTRNDLEDPALCIAPAIGGVLAALRGVQSCLLARMSGSGATCFGLFPDKQTAASAAAALRDAHPGWWVVPTRLGVS